MQYDTSRSSLDFMGYSSDPGTCRFSICISLASLLNEPWWVCLVRLTFDDFVLWAHQLKDKHVEELNRERSLTVWICRCGFPAGSFIDPKDYSVSLSLQTWIFFAVCHWKWCWIWNHIVRFSVTFTFFPDSICKQNLDVFGSPSRRTFIQFFLFTYRCRNKWPTIS